jgi:hypothetical protein
VKRAIVALLLSAPALLGAQNARSALDSLGDATSIALTRYADRSAASAAGYRRIGPDFPGMGEHWLNPRVLLSGSLDPSQPTILIYADVAGAPRLLGAGFVTTTRGEARAAGVPGWPDAWHEHSGLLSDESGVSPGSRAPTTTRVWVLHVWSGLENPGGRYAPDNWALPFVRAGLGSPERADADAGRSVALASTGGDYLRDLLTDAGVRDSTNAPRIDAAIAAARLRSESVVARARTRPGAVASVDDVVALRAEWTSLEHSLRTIAGPAVTSLLAPPHPAAAREHHPAAAREGAS